MGLSESLAFYVLAGLAVGVANVLAQGRESVVRSAITMIATCLFWPLYLPILLSRRAETAASEDEAAPREPDALEGAIAQVERELDAALRGLDGWAEDALSSESTRIAELRLALAAQASRVRQMDSLLAATEQAGPAWQPASLAASDAIERWQASQTARAENLARLREARDRAETNLIATLAWIRELVSMIHLAKFTGAPASRAEELVAQIAAAVEGVSAVSWKAEGAERDRGARAPLPNIESTNLDLELQLLRE